MLTKSRLMMLLPLLALTLRLINEGAANLSYLVLALFALCGPAQAIEAFAWSWLFTVINPGIAPEASQATVGRYIVIAASALSVLIGNWLRNGGPAHQVGRASLQTALLSAVIGIHALLFSFEPSVSILKSTSWAIVMLTMLGAWGALSSQRRYLLRRRLSIGLGCVVILSIPFVLIPDIGYLKNGSGFQGLLFHPQAFGPTAAIFAALVLGHLAESPRPSWLGVGLLVCSVALILLSEARVAALGFFGGALVSFWTVRWFNGRPLSVLAPGLRSSRAVILCVGVAVTLALAWPVVSERISAFALKRSDASDLSGAAAASRGDLVDRMISNIQDSPWRGIGFGIASEPEYMEVQRDPFFGLPVSAQVEKGVLPLAVIEELGIALALLVFAWMLSMAKRAGANGLSSLQLVLTVYFLNLGEAALLSVGGMGLLLALALSASSAVIPIQHGHP